MAFPVIALFFPVFSPLFPSIPPHPLQILRNSGTFVPQIVVSMQTTVTAIVLSLQPYSDKAHILHAYTREGGRVNYMVYGLGRKKNAAQYAPLSLVEIVESASPSRAMRTIKQSRLLYVPSRTMTDMRRQSVALFIAEVLYRTLRHPMEDPNLFAFLEQTVQMLDQCDEPENLHLQFLIGLASLLGFAIDEDARPDLVAAPANRAERQARLLALCDYFATHIDDWQSPRSLPILMEIFD